jgi:hypothetical protein
MNIFKLVLVIVLTALAVFLGLALIGYVFWFAVIALAVFIAVKLFKPSRAPRIEGRQLPPELHDATDTLRRTEQVLAEYKRKYLPK